MKVFGFLYCDCIHESAFATMSLHKTLKGAEMAMEFHKAEAKKEWEEMNEWRGKELFEFGSMKGWLIKEMEIQE